jgi:nonribosomal peptide synthetase DhbF
MTADGFLETADSAARPKADPISDPFGAELAGASPRRAPRSTRQEILCGIFADVLRLPRVGIYDDFFSLGGRSIDGALIASRANAELSSQLSLVDLFDAPTVAELDQLLNGRTDDDSQDGRG